MQWPGSACFLSLCVMISMGLILCRTAQGGQGKQAAKKSPM
jgi:hypothetical protein